MKITYISHATLLIETNGKKILTDPWVFGSTYCHQWFLFPPAQHDVKDQLNDIDYVLISHGHEDHTHEGTLKLINKSAKIFFPYSWYDGAVKYFKELGFENIIEAVNEKKYQLSDNINVVFYANNLDNMMVIESEGKTILNINDSLPSSSPILVEYFIHKIKKNHPNITYLFSSYGGASYYPNTIKYAYKNDVEIGKYRELFFVNNFCKMVEKIDAKYYIPFASDFVLLNPNQLWINDVKFKRSEVANYFNSNYQKNNTTKNIIELYPADVIDNDTISKNSIYHDKLRQHDLAVLVKEVYGKEMEEKSTVKLISEDEFKETFTKIYNHILSNKSSLPEAIIPQMKFQIEISDYVEGKNKIAVDLSHQNNNIIMTQKPMESIHLNIKISSKIINYSLDYEWGGDAIIIGYGCEIEIYDEMTLKNEIDNYVVQLLTRYPNTKSYLKRQPLRAVKYLLSDKIKRHAFLDKLFKGKNTNFSDPLLKKNDIWVNRTNCEICKKCNLPELTNEEMLKYYSLK